MEVAFCVLNIDTTAISKRKDGGHLFPSPVRSDAGQVLLLLHSGFGSAQKSFLIFNFLSCNSSVSQALNFKRGIITTPSHTVVGRLNVLIHIRCLEDL